MGKAATPQYDGKRLAARAHVRYTSAMFDTPDTFSHYGPVAILLLIGLAFAVGNVVISRLLGPDRQGKIKGMTYESGVNPFSDARRRFNVRFYIVAMAFLVFDVEIVFLYPWGVVFNNIDPVADPAMRQLFLARVLFFVLTTIVAYLYAWRKGVFRYD